MTWKTCQSCESMYDDETQAAECEHAVLASAWPACSEPDCVEQGVSTACAHSFQALPARLQRLAVRDSIRWLRALDKGD